MRRLTALLLCLSVLPPAAWAVFDSADKPVKPALSIVRAAPEGTEVPAPTRQIVITFDRLVVPLGDMQIASDKAPATIEPQAPCHWHWLDPRSLACELDLDGALAPATEYRVTVKGGLKAVDDTVFGKPYTWHFTTERPVVTGYSFHTWTSPGTPVIRLTFNQPVTKDSVESSIKLSGFTLTASPDPYFSEVFFVLPMPHEGAAMVFPAGTQARLSDSQTRSVTRDDGTRVEARRIWLVTPTREMQGNATAHLTVAPGLRSALGPLLGTESRTLVDVDSFPDFRFLGVRCQVGAERVLLSPGSQEAQSSRCNPFNPVALVFSSPVIPLEIKAHLVLSPDLAGGRADYDPWANIYPMSWLRSPHRLGEEYDIDLPERLRAFQPYSIAKLGNLRDEFNRPLTGLGEMRFHTAHRVPKLKLTHPIAVLEKNAPTGMPLYVTNLTGIDLQYRTLTPTGAAHDLKSHQAVDRVWDKSYAVQAPIRPLLGGQSGVVSGSFDPHPGIKSVTGPDVDAEDDTDPGIPNGRPDRDFFAEVTPFQVHAKLGQYNTLVWVTTLADGKVVPGARVRLYKDAYHTLTDAPEVLAEAKPAPTARPCCRAGACTTWTPRPGVGATATD